MSNCINETNVESAKDFQPGINTAVLKLYNSVPIELDKVKNRVIAQQGYMKML